MTGLPLSIYPILSMVLMIASAEIQLFTRSSAFVPSSISPVSRRNPLVSRASRSCPLIFTRLSTTTESSTQLGLITCDNAISIAKTAADVYSTLLIEHPLPTKSLTAGILCGISDIIAQRRDITREEFNIGRTLRFASKWCIGGIVWTFWYNWLDGFLTFESPTSFYTLVGVTDLSIFAKSHIGLVTTVLSILLEQFFWCPLVYGTFEIPLSTLMNGGELNGIKDEVDAKLNGLLISNAKVWTIANIVIYNAPLEWRLFIGNCIDIFWQSIVSDVSADGGEVEDDVCEIEDFSSVEDNPSFYAEKSRI